MVHSRDVAGSALPRPNLATLAARITTAMDSRRRTYLQSARRGGADGTLSRHDDRNGDGRAAETQNLLFRKVMVDAVAAFSLAKPSNPADEEKFAPLTGACCMDLALRTPFGRIAGVPSDLGMAICGGIVAYLGWNAFRDANVVEHRPRRYTGIASQITVELQQGRRHSSLYKLSNAWGL